MALSYDIRGTVLPVVTVTLKPEDRMYASTGSMSWMSGNVQMETNSGGGIGRMFKRALSGESLFVADFFVERGMGSVAFAAEYPGQILPVELAPGQTRIVQRDAFLAAEKSVEMDLHLKRQLGAGLFGGEGFFLQKITGPGTAFVNFDGEIVEMLLTPGETLKVDTGHVAMFEPSVQFSIETVRGFKNILFGGEGLFLTTLTGPGRVWLQTMPLSKLAAKLIPLWPTPPGSSK